MGAIFSSSDDGFLSVLCVAVTLILQLHVVKPLHTSKKYTHSPGTLVLSCMCSQFQLQRLSHKDQTEYFNMNLRETSCQNL